MRRAQANSWRTRERWSRSCSAIPRGSSGAAPDQLNPGRAAMSKPTRSSMRRFERAVRIHELPLMVGLVVLWSMLWGEFSPLSVISGVVVAVVVMRLFYLPPVDLGGHFNLWH